MARSKDAARAALKSIGIEPRALTASEAAAYCCAGSVTAFTAAVENGTFPQPIRLTGSHPIWDRRALDAALDRLSRLSTTPGLTAATDAANDEVPPETRAAIREAIATARL